MVDPAAPEGVPFMITRQMRADLIARGITPEQIRSMTPAQAHEILRAARPGPAPATAADPGAPGARASDTPIAEGSKGRPFDDDLAKEFETAPGTGDSGDTITALRLRLRKGGYHPIPAEGKVPPMKGWQDKFDTTPEEIRFWGRSWHRARNTGVLAKFAPGLDIDLLDEEACEAIEALVNRTVSDDDSHTPVRVGQYPKRLIPFRTATPFKKLVLNVTAPNGTAGKVEFLGEGQHYVCDGIHPATHMPYVWHGTKCLADVPHAELPLIRDEQHAQEMLDEIGAMLVAEHGYRIERPKAKAGNEGKPSGSFGFNTKPSRDDGELKALLEASRVQGQWHDSMRDAIATMVGRGWTDAAIRFACGPYCKGGTDDPDLVPLIEGAREKWNKPNEDAAQQPRRRETGTWNEPDISILDDRRGELPDFPAGVLSEKWEEWLARAAHGAGVTRGHVAVPLLATVASLIGTARRIRPSRSWSEPLTLWDAIVGFSGSGKTPGMGVTKRALSWVENNRKERIAELQRRHDTKSQTAKAAAKAWKKKVEEAVEANQPPPQMPVEAMDPGLFVTPRLYVSDATIERHAVLLQAGPRGMLLMSDELASLFLNMGRYSNGSDKEFWLEAWNGHHYVVERMGRPSVRIDHLLIGMTGGFQPDKLARSFEGDSDGMHARVLFAWPEEPAFHSLTDDVTEIEPELLNALCRIVDLPAGEDDVFAPRDVSLSADARTQFEEFRYFQHRGKDALDGREREWWAKGPSQVLRLAGTLCYLDWAMEGGPEPQAVEARFIEAAVRLWRDYFWPHSRAAVRQIGLTDRHAEARRVLRWLKAGNRQEVSREEVRCEALTRRLNADQVQTIIDGLARAGWLREVTAKAEGPGRPARRWEVNPRLSTIH
jgi:hypothetical protein